MGFRNSVALERRVLTYCVRKSCVVVHCVNVVSACGKNSDPDYAGTMAHLLNVDRHHSTTRRSHHTSWHNWLHLSNVEKHTVCTNSVGQRATSCSDANENTHYTECHFWLEAVSRLPAAEVQQSRRHGWTNEEVQRPRSLVSVRPSPLGLLGFWNSHKSHTRTIGTTAQAYGTWKTFETVSMSTADTGFKRL